MRYEVKCTTMESMFTLWRLLNNLEIMSDDSVRSSWAGMQMLQSIAIANNYKIARPRYWVDID